MRLDVLLGCSEMARHLAEHVRCQRAFNFTLTANYTSGYSSTAADSGGVYKDCIQSALNGQLATYDNGDPVSATARRPSGSMLTPNTNR